VLAGLFGMMLGMRMMAMRDVGMVAGFFFISGSVMLSRGAMMFRRVLVMFGRFQMVVLAFFRHGALFLRLRDPGLRISSRCESAITGR
jgi:hypothetical protein